MAKSTTSVANDTPNLSSETSPAPEAAKPTRKRRMAREPGEALATALAASATAEAEIAPSPASKTATVLALLRRDEGATLEEMTAATGWLPHTTRAVLTGLRKKGHVVERGKRDEITIWRIVGEA